MHQHSPEELLEHYRHRVAKIMQEFMDTMLSSVVPEGEALEAYRQRHRIEITQEKLRHGLCYTVAVDGVVVGELEYNDGAITADLDFRPYIGRRYPSS